MLPMLTTTTDPTRDGVVAVIPPEHVPKLRFMLAEQMLADEALRQEGARARLDTSNVVDRLAFYGELARGLNDDRATY